MFNPYILVPFAVWAIVQVIKFVAASRHGEIKFKFLYASGGMPSAHSAVVTSLATTAALLDGVQSHLFGLTAILAAIVMYDALGVRRAVGEQATALNNLLELLARDRSKHEMPERLREVLGHYPHEVAAGALLGIGLGGLFNYDRLGWLTSFLTAVPTRIESWVYLGVATALILIGLAVKVILPWRVKKSPSMRRLAQTIFTWFESVGFLGLVMWFCQFERVSYLAWRLWWMVVAGLIVLALWRIGLVMFRQVPEERAAELAHERRAKWFNWGRKRKRK